MLNVFWPTQEMFVYSLLAFTWAVSLELKALGVPEVPDCAIERTLAETVS